jgi:pilus assembly protein CpaF
MEPADPHGGLIREMKARLAAGSLSPDPAAVAAALTEQRCLLGPKGIEALSQVICEEFLGNDPVAVYLCDPDVTDVLINGCATTWVERAGRLEQVENTFPDEEAVRAYAQRLAIRAGRRVDDASPFVDARLPDGTRMHAILPPLAVEGTTISLRIPRRQAYTLTELNSFGTLADEAVGLLTELVEKRVAFLITGGAGTGKTTLSRHDALPCRSGGAAGPGRGLRGTHARPPARRASRVEAAQPGRPRPRHDPRTRPPGTPNAPEQDHPR